MHKKLLIVDDDPLFCSVLAKAMTRRGFIATIAHDAQEAQEAVELTSPDYAVIDLKMPGESGLTLVVALKNRFPALRIVVLTGYASIATAIEAVKLGATYYLAKPADIDAIIEAFGKDEGNSTMPVTDTPPSINKLQWEYMQKVLADTGGNISEAARILGMHRRTLQRKLAKKPVRD